MELSVTRPVVTIKRGPQKGGWRWRGWGVVGWGEGDRNTEGAGILNTGLGLSVERVLSTRSQLRPGV